MELLSPKQIELNNKNEADIDFWYLMGLFIDEENKTIEVSHF